MIRRDFLRRVGACCAGAALARYSQGGPPNPSGVKAIDIHYHVTTDAMRKAAGGNNLAIIPKWTPQNALATMDREGVEISVISMPVSPETIPEGEAAHRSFARDANQEAAAIVAARPQRFRFFASLPLPYIDATLEEIHYAFDVLKADGVYMSTSYTDKWLGDPVFRPVMNELNRRKSIVYTHPMGAACCVSLMPYVSPPVVEYGTDTTRAIASLIFSGTAAQLPDIRFLFSHAGGAAPFLFERFDLESRRTKQQTPAGALPLFRAFFYDTAQAANPYALGTLLRLVPSTQVLFGSDYPWRTAGEQLTAMDAMNLGTAVTDDIRARNARRILPSLANAGT